MAEILINTLKKTRSDLSKGRGHTDALCGCHNRTLYHNFGAECEKEEDLLTLSMLPLIVKRNCCKSSSNITFISRLSAILTF